MTQATLSAHEEPLRKVFSSEFEFRVPDYQRPYRWGTDQAVQLLDDLEETLERNDGEPYFLGSLVLVGQSGTPFDVIDGQQRLTTLTILFSVLRDLAEGEEFSRNLADRVVDPGNELDGISARPRLTLRDQDAPFFRKYVQESGRIATLIGLSDAPLTTESQQAIRNNARALHERLATWPDARRKALATLASTRTYLVVVRTANMESANRIFGVMNARGLDLTPADIFKSRVIGSLREAPEYVEQWESTEAALGSDDFTSLFGDIRTIVSEERPRRELLHEFPAQVLDGYLQSERAAAFMDDLLLPYASAFERTKSPYFGSEKEWASVSQWLKWLSLIDNKDWRPCALWALVKHADDPVFLNAFFRKLERIAATELLRGTYATPRMTRYLDLLKELNRGGGLDAAAFTFSGADKAHALAQLGGNVYHWYTQRSRYVLLRLDELLSEDQGATYSQEVVSIEHVLPQQPRPGSHWLADFTEEQHTDLVHKLGNLLLLSRRKNSQAQNYEFAEKKDRYFSNRSGSTTFALTTQVLKEHVWTPEVIERRQEQLVSILAREWELN